MKTSPLLVVAGVVASVSIALVAQVYAGADKVAFPENYAKGVRYASDNNVGLKEVHDLYAMPAAFEAARKGQPMPDGTVLVIARFAAKLDAQGNPIKDTNGHFIKDKPSGFNVMEKRAGWGAEYPEAKRNGEWEYRAFTADKTPNDKANLAACFGCHKPLTSQDYVQSYDKLKTAKN